MAPESNKMMRQLSGDIISNLPRDVIDNILTRLPLLEAGRTSILSQRWRYMWAYLPSLEFDYDTFAETTQKTQDQLLIAIYEILLLKRVPIVKFVLSVPGLESIDPLVSFVSRNGCLKELSLHLEDDEDEQYKLPPSLFSCMGLTRLSLGCCAIEPPIQFKGFNRLVSLDIRDCFVLPGIFSDLISSCPLLETLTVALLNLEDGHIQISAPNLRNLNFTGGLASISFKYTPRLSKCVLFIYHSTLTRETSNAFESFCNLVAVEDMMIDLVYYRDELVDNNSLPRKLTTSLNNLKSLTLSLSISFHILYEVSLVLCLIWSSPNLKKIVFLEVQRGETNAADLEQVTHLLDVQEWSEISLNCLREAEVHKITGNACELGFIKLLLAISPKLETMTVSPDASVAVQGRLEILTKLTGLRRRSPLAEIIYKY